MPGLPVPLLAEPAFVITALEGNVIERSPKTMRASYRLGRDVTLTSATLIDQHGTRYPLTVSDGELHFELTEDFPHGPITFEVDLGQRTFTRTGYAVTGYEVRPLIEFVGGGTTVTHGGMTFRTQDEEFRVAGELTIAKPVELRQSGSLVARRATPFEASFSAELQASRAITLSFSVQREPASLLLQARQEDEDFILMGLLG